ncbi:glycosyltransferase family 2 protein [Comamonas sp. JC664]|uniref:glycosyltransferase family 2 protein n=1 Tax=Comamonas sp. JC664 TaxID=2801917 RepID=UPI003623C809
MINDASPEPELTAWLRELAQQDSRVRLLENDSNLGFVATVNRGMALNPSHDVLLLNSDTEVSHEWLDRLHRRPTAPRCGQRHAAVQQRDDLQLPALLRKECAAGRRRSAAPEPPGRQRQCRADGRGAHRRGLLHVHPPRLPCADRPV